MISSVHVLPELVKVLRTGSVACAINHRINFLDVHDMHVEEVQGAKMTELMQLVIRKYWSRLFLQLDENFVLTGYCPYVIAKRTLEMDGKKVRVDVPIALRPGDYTMSQTTNEDFETEIEFRVLGVMKQPDIQVVNSTTRSGPSRVNPDDIDSDCGAILHEWRKLQRRHDVAAAAQKLTIFPTLHLEHVISNTTRATETEVKLFNDHLNQRRFDMDHGGYEDETVRLELNTEQQTVVIPAMFTASRFQHVPETSLMNTTIADNDFQHFVYNVLGIPSINENTKSTRSGRTHSAVQEDRAIFMATIQRLVGDRSNAMADIWMRMYHTRVKFHIPHRTQLDISTVAYLAEIGVLDPRMARNEFATITGITDVTKGDEPLDFGETKTKLDDGGDSKRHKEGE